MTRETYDKAENIVSEIERIDMLINYISTSENEFSDMLYLANLLGKEEVLMFMRTRRRTLEHELEQL